MSETPPPYRTNHHHQDIVKHTEILDAYEDHKKSFDGEDDEEDLSLSTNEILNNAAKLENIPGYIIQGRYDLICPPVNAYNLSQKWKGSKLKIINTAGHSSSDEGIMENMQLSLEKLIKGI